MKRVSSQPWRLLVPVAFVAASLALSACGGGGGSQPLPTQPPVGAKPAEASPATGGGTAGNPAAGQQAIAKSGCGGCHTIPGVQGAAGTVGPSLAGFAKRTVIAGTSASNTPENLSKWIMDPQAIKPGTAMPNTGVSQADAQNIAAYLRTLQ